jgi:hypothetical protein
VGSNPTPPVTITSKMALEVFFTSSNLLPFTSMLETLILIVSLAILKPLIVLYSVAITPLL